MVQDQSGLKVAEGHNLNGHLGRLTEDQEQALQTFKETLTTAGLYTPPTEGSPGSHNDATLL